MRIADRDSSYGVDPLVHRCNLATVFWALVSCVKPEPSQACLVRVFCWLLYEAVQAAYPNNALAIYTPQVWALARVEVDAYAVTTEDGIPQTLYQTLSGSASSALALWKSQNVLSQYSLSALTDYANTNGGSVQQSSAPTANS